MKNISIGDTGDKVKRIQKHLKHINYYTGSISGTFDEATENAVKAFQKDNSLSETGIVNYKTLSLIAAKSKEAGPIVVKKAEEKKKENVTVSTETGRWNNHTFVVASNLIRSFSDLTIKGASEMESKDKNTTGYVTRKGGSPTEVSITVLLNQLAGCDVREESMKWVEEARNGATDHFYVGNKKLAEYKFMLTDASVSKVEISHNGTWITATVSLTFKQSNGETSSGSSSGSSGGSGGYSGGSSGGYSGGSYSGSGSQKVSVNSTSPTTSTVPKYQFGNPLTKNYADTSKFSIGMPSNGTGFTGGVKLGSSTTSTNTQQNVQTGTSSVNFFRNLGKEVTSGSKTTGTTYLVGLGGAGH